MGKDQSAGHGANPFGTVRNNNMTNADWWPLPRRSQSTWKVVELVVLPVSVGLAYTQELAARAINPQARVVSTTAKQVGGESAMELWVETCGFISGSLVNASPRERLILGFSVDLHEAARKH